MSPTTINRDHVGRFAPGARGATGPSLLPDPFGDRAADGTQDLATRLLNRAGDDDARERSGLDAPGYYLGRAQASAEVAWMLGDADRWANGSFHGGRALLLQRTNCEPVPDTQGITNDRADALAKYSLLQAYSANDGLTLSKYMTTSPGTGTEQEQADRSRSYYLEVGRRDAYTEAYADLRFARKDDLQRSTAADRLHRLLTDTEDLEFSGVLDADTDWQEEL